MRTLIWLALGSLLAAACIRLTTPSRQLLARRIFCNVWLLLCMVSLRNSAAHGHALIDEIPIHLLIFAIPAAITFRLTRQPEPAT